MRKKKLLFRGAQIVAVGLVSWLLIPQSILPTLIFLVLLVRVGFDVFRHRTVRFVWILVLVFAAVGVVHDVNVPSYTSALCADGTYSYSAQRSGTCSWHHGVAVWHLRIPPWWERFTK